MAERIVIGLFDAIGTAEDVRNRLIYEGVPEADIDLRVLKQVEPLPPSMAPETSKFAVDILLTTTVREKYAPLIHNGETAVGVRAHSDEEVETAINTMRQFAPIEIDSLDPAEEPSFVAAHAQAAKTPP
ncbi:MAG TPA: hypothetical protein VN681_08215 [Stellaceae bacterium]|nr:hypothetical protein [Stellaceae bacterium]